MFVIKSEQQLNVSLPDRFNETTMYQFINTVIDEQCDAKCSEIVFDFSTLRFIEPVGVVVLSNLIEYFKKIEVKVSFRGHKKASPANIYLDDSNFFFQYLNLYVFGNHSERTTTIPLELVTNSEAISFLNFKLMPWISHEVGLTPNSLAAIRTSIEEVFLNIRDHSGVGIGCVFSQHYPQKSLIKLAISDFGRGIPTLVRTQVPNITDADALRLACKEGFTTKSNVRNRGAGLTNIMRYITQRNNGVVWVHSGYAQLSAVKSLLNKEPNITVRNLDNYYPGTLVRALIRTDTLERIIEDSEPEVFEW